MNSANNLLLNVHRWASRQDENFTTEAFVHLIRHFLEYNPAIGVRLLNKLTGDHLSLHEENASSVAITTQFITSGHGTPDIKIEGPGFLIYVEVKVSSFPSLSQLESYNRALEGSDKGKTRLILISRYPFEDSTIPNLHAVRWYQIADWIEAELENVQEPTLYVTQQFLGYMKKRNFLITKVRGNISKGLKSYQLGPGKGSILSKRILSPAKLKADPDLLPLYNLLMMVQQALIDTGLSFKVKFDSGGQDGGWIGYNLNEMAYFVTVRYDQPEILIFETYNRRIEPEKFDGKNGHLFTPHKRLKWRIFLDLASSDLNFFDQPKAKQIDLIRDFIVNSWKIAESISNPWN